jgi:hypothetical protein
MQAADGLRRLPGQRDVDAVLGQAGVELARLELRSALLDELLERLPRLVGGAADGAALFGRELGDASEQVRELGLAAEVADAQLLECRTGGSAGDGRLGLGAE